MSYSQNTKVPVAPRGQDPNLACLACKLEGKEPSALPESLQPEQGEDGAALLGREVCRTCAMFCFAHFVGAGIGESGIL